jgi:hypothetical protein
MTSKTVIDSADVLQRVVVEVDELLRTEVVRLRRSEARRCR